MDIRTILAATDLSPSAIAAVRRAALIARAHDARLELIHVIPESTRSAVWQEFRALMTGPELDLSAAVAESLDALVAQIETESSVKAHVSIVEGKPFAEIAARAVAIDADVIVVGAHGENIVLTPMLGTTAHRVLQFARTPVLLVKQTPSSDDFAQPGYRHIVVATDFSADSLQAAKSARRLFPQSRVTLLHAYQAPFEGKLVGRVSEEALAHYRGRALAQANRDLQSFAAAADAADRRQVAVHGLPSACILQFAADNSADLIAIGSEEVARLQNALLGSVSLDVLTRAHCDVLLARASAR